MSLNSMDIPSTAHISTLVNSVWTLPVRSVPIQAAPKLSSLLDAILDEIVADILLDDILNEQIQENEQPTESTPPDKSLRSSMKEL
jgi:hypothetical protein